MVLLTINGRTKVRFRRSESTALKGFVAEPEPKEFQRGAALSKPHTLKNTILIDEQML